MSGRRLRVGVIFGGRSGEHEVSVMSARGIVGALDSERFEPVLIGIDRKGQWNLLAADALAGDSDAPANQVVGAGKLTPIRQVVPSELVTDGQAGAAVDIFFPIVHGTQGEDGCLQGLLEMVGVAYVGCGVLGSAVGMDKDISKRLMREAGLPVVDCVVARAGEEELSFWIDRVGEQLGFPCFVKPANLGSSVGIGKASDRETLSRALANAFRYDRKVIVERAVKAREIEIAVLGGEPVGVSLPGEIVLRDDFYSYEAKYLDADGAELLVPAPLDEQQIDICRQLAQKAFRCLDLEGLARVDFFLENMTGKWFVNEVNTLPGFTPISMYAKMWESSGLPYDRLLTSLIDLGLARFKLRRGLVVDRE